MRRILSVLICLYLLSAAGLAEGNRLVYRFADAKEAAALLLSNREYYENLSQNDLNYRMQKQGATLEEYEAFVARQTLDYTEEEKAVIDAAMAFIEDVCDRRGYALPPIDLVFSKTTMAEAYDAGGYTHGTQIYLGKDLLDIALQSEEEVAQDLLHEIVAHELFHCLTRNHPDFRAEMYALLGFTIADADFPLPRSILDRCISNPDVEHHDAYAAFEIDGETRNCVIIWTTTKPFEQPGDSFFDDSLTGLVPIDDLSTLYFASDASNFWDVFGRNTDYVVDPEEVLADNFCLTIAYGLEGVDYPNPEIIEAIDACLKGYATKEEAA